MIKTVGIIHKPKHGYVAKFEQLILLKSRDIYKKSQNNRFALLWAPTSWSEPFILFGMLKRLWVQNSPHDSVHIIRNLQKKSESLDMLRSKAYIFHMILYLSVFLLLKKKYYGTLNDDLNHWNCSHAQTRLHVQIWAIDHSGFSKYLQRTAKP